MRIPQRKEIMCHKSVNSERKVFTNYYHLGFEVHHRGIVLCDYWFPF